MVQKRPWNISNNKHRYPKTIKTSNPLGKQIEYTRYHFLDNEIDSIISSIKIYVKEGYDQQEIAVLYKLQTHAEKAREKFDQNGLREVDVTTIHSSKGKEYDNVYVAGLNDNLLPFFESKKNIFDDERNVFFVAISRAKKMLFLSLHFKKPTAELLSAFAKLLILRQYTTKINYVNYIIFWQTSQ